MGAGLVFGSGVGSGDLDNDLGVRVDGYYAITPVIRAGGDFTFYFPSSVSESMSPSPFGPLNALGAM